MNSKLKAFGVGLACLVCCLPLIFAITGITAGATGAVGYWLGRNEAILVAGIGLIYLATVVVRHLRTPGPTERRFPPPNDREQTYEHLRRNRILRPRTHRPGHRHPASQQSADRGSS